MQREIDRRIAAGKTPVLLFHQPGTKTRPGPVSLGEFIDLDSHDVKRLRKAREFLGLPPLDLPDHDLK